MDWNSRARDHLVTSVVEWLYELERDTEKGNGYYQFGVTSMDRYFNDAIFKCRVDSLVTRLTPIIDSTLLEALFELKERYAK